MPPQLREYKPQAPPARYLRKCGHPNDWTLDLVTLDNVIVSYCMGCVASKLGLKPVSKYKIVKNKEHPEGTLVKIWEEQ